MSKINLHYNTVSPLLLNSLLELMKSEVFSSFRLVGGTALSLYYGHRMSVDIDLFTDAKYGTIDFEAIDDFLRNNFTYVSTNAIDMIGFGKTYFIGNHKEDCIKLDLFYTDEFISTFHEIDHIRISGVEDIIAMKVDLVAKGARKKDFWDLHELIDHYSIDQMIQFYQKRYPFNEDVKTVKNKFSDFSQAEDDFTPICLKHKHWEIIKLDMTEIADDPI